jgi:hypothetical protein
MSKADRSLSFESKDPNSRAVDQALMVFPVRERRRDNTAMMQSNHIFSLLGLSPISSRLPWALEVSTKS